MKKVILVILALLCAAPHDAAAERKARKETPALADPVATPTDPSVEARRFLRAFTKLSPDAQKMVIDYLMRAASEAAAAVMAPDPPAPAKPMAAAALLRPTTTSATRQAINKESDQISIGE